MTIDRLSQFLRTQEALRSQLEPFSAAAKGLEIHSGVQRMVEEANRTQNLVRAALGPIDELRRSGAFERVLETAAQTRQLCDSVARFEAAFRLPKIAEATSLLRSIETGPVAEIVKRYNSQTSKVQRAIESMHTPWLNTQDKLGSLTGFTALQGIGHAIRTIPAFDPGLADRLRLDLGDWQKRIDWPATIFTDPVARTDFYTERGLDPLLTAFPASAFEESVSIAGLKEPLPPPVSPYEYERHTEEDEEEAGFARTNAAHDRLQRFESHIRKFIDAQMTVAFGENWSKHRVPGKILTAWREKRQMAKDNGEPDRPLIAYADFADYVPIITRRDNWQAVFEPIFGRQMIVQESFQRLHPIRICTMHARIITQDDELYLYVETKRVLAAIGIEI